MVCSMIVAALCLRDNTALASSGKGAANASTFVKEGFKSLIWSTCVALTLQVVLLMSHCRLAVTTNVTVTLCSAAAGVALST